MPTLESDLFVKALEAAREYAQSLTDINTSILWEVLGFYKKNLRSPKTDRSAHNLVMLRSLSMLSAQCSYHVFVRWSQQL